MTWFEYLLTETTLGRAIVFKEVKKTVDKSSGGFYPAPYSIIDVVKDNFGKTEFEHQLDEAKRFSVLAATPQSEALIGIFHGTNAVKKHSFGKPSHPVKTIAVLGAGLMGAGIAQVSVDNGGYRVLLKDKDTTGVARGEKIIDDALKGKLAKKRMTEFEYTEKSSRLIPLHDGIESWKKHFSTADLVIEGERVYILEKFISKDSNYRFFNIILLFFFLFFFHYEVSMIIYFHLLISSFF